MKTKSSEKEIARLNEQVAALKENVSSLQRIVALCDVDRMERIETDLQNMAGENAHLLVRLSMVDGENMCPLLVELKALAATGRMVKKMQAEGYRQAAEDLRGFARKQSNPLPYDLLMSLAIEMDRRIADYVAA